MSPHTEDTRETLARVAAARPDAIQDALGLWGPLPKPAELDERDMALVRIAALIALDAPPAAFARQVADAEEAGISPAAMVGVLQAIAPQVGSLKAIAAAPELMLALGLALPAAPHEDDGAR